MNLYEMRANAYREAGEEGELPTEYVEKRCKALDYIAECDEEDYNNLFDTSVFNYIMMAYVSVAMHNLGEDMPDELKGYMRSELRYLLDDYTAKQIQDEWDKL